MTFEFMDIEYVISDLLCSIDAPMPQVIFLCYILSRFSNP